MNFQTELLKIDVGAAPLQNPWLPSASSSSGPKCFQGPQNATPFQLLVWKGLLLFADGCKLFYWFRVAASHTTRNSPYPCGKHTAASSKVFWCRAASLGWPCNAPQPAWENSSQPWSNQHGWQGQRAVPVSPHPTAQLTAVLNHQWIKHAGSRHFLGWGRTKLFRSHLDAPIVLRCITASVTGVCAFT